MPCLIDLVDDGAGEQALASIDRQRLQDLIDRCLIEESDQQDTSWQLTVLLVDAETSAAIHAEHFGVPGRTDVMSFPDGSINPENDRRLIGELVVCPAVASDAVAADPEQRRSVSDELLLYILHGTLHCLGFDDIDEDDRREMWQRQTELLAPLGISIRDD